MTLGSEPQDPFLSKPAGPIRSGRAIDAPAPTGPRFDGAPPPSGAHRASWSAIPDPEVYGPPPLGGYPQPFARTWKVTRRRWGRAWLAFLALGALFGVLLGTAYPAPHGYDETYGVSYSIGTFFGLTMSFLALFGWWLDHILAQAGFKVSLLVQAILAGGVGLMAGSGAETSGDPLGYPTGYLFLFGVLAVALTHVANRKVEGSFKPSEESAYSPSTW